MVKRECITLEQFGALFDLCEKGQFAGRKAIIRTISDLSLKMGYREFEFVLNRLAQFPPELYSEDMVELIYDACKYSVVAHTSKGM